MKRSPPGMTEGTVGSTKGNGLMKTIYEVCGWWLTIINAAAVAGSVARYGFGSTELIVPYAAAILGLCLLVAALGLSRGRQADSPNEKPAGSPNDPLTMQHANP